MEAEELKNLWALYDAKLEQTLSVSTTLRAAMLNEQLNERTGRLQSTLKPLLYWRAAEAFVALVVVSWLADFIIATLPALELVLPAAVLAVCVIVGLVGSVQQIVLISTMDYAQPIAELQQRLTLIALHAVQFLRFGIVQLPLWAAYMIVGFKVLWDVNIVSEANPAFWMAVGAVSMAFIPLTIWLYRSLRYENRHSKWVQTVFDSIGGKHLATAMQFVEDLKTFTEESSLEHDVV
jgi:uncharacterized membrane protein